MSIRELISLIQVYKDNKIPPKEISENHNMTKEGNSTKNQEGSNETRVNLKNMKKSTNEMPLNSSRRSKKQASNGKVAKNKKVTFPLASIENFVNPKSKFTTSKLVEPESAILSSRNKSKISKPVIHESSPPDLNYKSLFQAIKYKSAGPYGIQNHSSSTSSLLTSKKLKSETFKQLKKHRKKDHIFIVSKGLSFKLLVLTLILFIFLSIICLLQLIFFYAYYPRTVRIENYIKAYVLGIETWNSITRAANSLYSAIAWNNTASFWGMSSISAFRIHADFIRDKVITNMTILVQEDLGDYSNNYTSLLLKVFSSPPSHLALFIDVFSNLSPRVIPARQCSVTEKDTKDATNI